MLYRLSIVILLLSLSPLLRSQGHSSPILQGIDLAGGTVTRSETFNGPALFGYINGGAELYLEYGFQRLDLQQITVANVEYTIQLYAMKSPLHAFGIFSINRQKCLPIDSLTQYSCLSSHQLQFAMSEFYISISNTSGSAGAQKFMILLARQLLKKINPQSFQLPEPFHRPALALYRQNLKLVYGRLGIQNGMTDWEERFEGLSGYRAFILPIEKGKEWIWVSVIEFGTMKTLEEFCIKQGFTNSPGSTFTHRTSEQSHLALRRLNASTLIFAEASKDNAPTLESLLEIFK